MSHANQLTEESVPSERVVLVEYFRERLVSPLGDPRIPYPSRAPVAPEIHPGLFTVYFLFFQLMLVAS